jgi:hypothetical protein
MRTAALRLGWGQWAVSLAGAWWLVGSAFLASSAARDPSAANAATATYELRLSVYQPTSTRDPFMPAHAKLSATAARPAQQTDFRLQGLLYSPTNPAAIINDQMVVLNKRVTVNTSRGPVEIKATEITRKHVILEVDGAKTELSLDSAATPAP